mgnify:CR=1 FL=1
MIQEPLTIGLAEKKDGEEIYALYHSLLDDPYGTWNEEYPSLECVQNDLEENIVYAMRDATGRIVSAIVDEQDIHEFDGLAPWYADVTRWAQLGRRGTASPAECWRTRWSRRRNAAARPSAFWWRPATSRRSARMPS